MKKRAPLEPGMIAGLDVGSIEYIHKEIVIMRDRGVAVLFVVGLYHGQIVARVNREEARREQLGLWMAEIHETA